MQIVAATSVVLVVLAMLIGAMAWQMKDAIDTSIHYQKEILAELIRSRIKSGDLRAPNLDTYAL